MKSEQATGRRGKVIGVQIDRELAVRVDAEVAARSNIVRKWTISDIVREALFARYFPVEGQEN